LKTIVEVPRETFAKAINTFSSCSPFRRGSQRTVYQVVGRARPSDVHEMLNHALKGDFLKARDELRTLLVKYGLSGPTLSARFIRKSSALPFQRRQELA